MSSVWSELSELVSIFYVYDISTVWANSGLEYPEVNTVVLLFARVTVSEPVV